jgi:hypothetical protein
MGKALSDNEVEPAPSLAMAVILKCVGRRANRGEPAGSPPGHAGDKR